mgnify:CR=1 FL=1
MYSLTSTMEPTWDHYREVNLAVTKKDKDGDFMIHPQVIPVTIAAGVRQFVACSGNRREQDALRTRAD